jgi:hypothetical protein
MTSRCWSSSSTSSRRSQPGEEAPSRDGAPFLLGGHVNAYEATSPQLQCPNCGTKLRACDLIIDRAAGVVVLICAGCHRDILAIESKS